MRNGTRRLGFPRLVPPPRLPNQSAASRSFLLSLGSGDPGQQAAVRMWGCGARTLLCLWEVRLAGFLGRRLSSSNAAAGKSFAPQCWNCGRSRGAGCGDEFFCAHCRALQPPDPTRDFFSLMNWYGRRVVTGGRLRLRNPGMAIKAWGGVRGPVISSQLGELRQNHTVQGQLRQFAETDSKQLKRWISV